MAAARGWRCLLPPVYNDWRLAAAAAAAAGGVGSSAQAAGAGQESADLTTSDDL